MYPRHGSWQWDSPLFVFDKWHLFMSMCQQAFIYQSVGWLQLELKYLRFIMQRTFPIFLKTDFVHVSMLPPGVWATEMWRLRVCASERCLARRLHRYCELFMNTKPFQSACVCVWFNVKNMSRLSLHLYTHSNTLYVNMNVGHITELLEVHGTRISSPVL